MQRILQITFLHLFPKSRSGLGRGFVASCLLVFFAGCQAYRPAALNLSAHAEAWKAKRASSEEVRAFAKRIAEFSPSEADFDPANGLSLEEGEIVALVFNPDLRVARLRAGVAEATASHAGLWDDPEISMDVLKITESIPDPWVIGSALSLTIPISGRLRAEKARTRAALHAELERVAESEWKVQRDLFNAWASWSAQRLQWEATSQIVDALDAIVDSTSRLAEGGEMFQTEAALFSIERESRRGELRQLEGEVAESVEAIKSLLGLAPSAPVDLLPALVVAPIETGADVTSESNLTLARLQTEYRVAEQTLLREIRKQYPDLTIGPQGESDQNQSRIGFIGSIPLPILESNRGGIAAARAEREVARAAFETEYERIVGRLASLRERLQGVRARGMTIDKTLIPLIDRQVDDARRLVGLGESGTLVLLESLVRAHEAKLKLIEVRLETARITNEIRYLVGPEPSGAAANEAP